MDRISNRRKSNKSQKTHQTKSNEDIDNGIDDGSGHEIISGSFDQNNNMIQDNDDNNIQVVDQHTDTDPNDPIQVTDFNRTPKTAVNNRTKNDMFASKNSQNVYS